MAPRASFFESLFPKEDISYLYAPIGALVTGQQLEQQCYLCGVSCSSKTLVLEFVRSFVKHENCKDTFPYGSKNAFVLSSFISCETNECADTAILVKALLTKGDHTKKNVTIIRQFPSWIN